ncbi:unnamed protein product [Chondrus crispus]|uniref:Uncharacterized protein n=1 Tax=Chondrus crispus TaxID=2769 RepID=R7QIG9_CHOCR|nr:unnamed protein product [Chondrus crispus]CDF37215.1 unnamed protein product [Chondrus crispus]|eukprot:XP_005717034.1 unnamed protein product [Chondrus crispus]
MLQENIRLLGVGNIIPHAPDDAADLAAVLHEVCVIRWNRFAAENRQLPQETGRFTPGSEGGKWVEFDPMRWCTNLDDDMYIEMADDDRPLESLVMGTRVYGTTNHLAQMNLPHGQPRGIRAVYGSDYSAPRLGRRSGAVLGSLTSQRRGVANDVLAALVLEREGLTALLRDNGVRGRPTIIAVLDLLQGRLESPPSPVQSDAGPAEAATDGSIMRAE